jgi:hypothetical protein
MEISPFPAHNVNYMPIHGGDRTLFEARPMYMSQLRLLLPGTRPILRSTSVKNLLTVFHSVLSATRMGHSYVVPTYWYYQRLSLRLDDLIDSRAITPLCQFCLSLEYSRILMDLFP